MREVLLYHANAPNGIRWIKERDGYRVPHGGWFPAWCLFQHGWRTTP
jgi:hypothetical protein